VNQTDFDLLPLFGGIAYTWSLSSGRKTLDSFQAKIEETPAAIESYLIDHAALTCGIPKILSIQSTYFGDVERPQMPAVDSKGVVKARDAYYSVDERLARLEVIPFIHHLRR
jgi:hypothetical protein